MAFIIAGERSGVGKTTVTLAVLAVLRHQGDRVQSFKVGPDYIDPMFHRYLTGRPCRNLDPMLTSETYVQQCFYTHSQDVDCAVIEGVMGLFDGAAFSPVPECPDFASTAHIARLLEVPVVLVVDCSRLSGSVAAIVHGYRTLDPRLRFAGVILNRVASDRHQHLLRTALEPLQIPVLGCLPRQAEIMIPDRHLGLVPTAELPALEQVIEQLTAIGKTCLDWEQLRPLLAPSALQRCPGPASGNQPDEVTPAHPPAQPQGKRAKAPVRIAVAYDRAFSFYYADNLEHLERLGAELLYWSPLQDRTLPEGVEGLYFGGGFPEVFAAELAENQEAIAQVRRAVQMGIPTYAECGGLMYLCEQIGDFEGQTWPMVGILPVQARMGTKLTLGYRRAIARQNSPLMPVGKAVYGHEFHRSTLTSPPTHPLYQFQHPDTRPTGQREEGEGWQLHQIHASYLHLHFGATPELPMRWLQHCGELALIRSP